MRTNYTLNSIVLLLFIFCCYMTTDIKAEPSAQKKTRTRLKVYYEKLSNNDKKISIILTQGSGKKASGVENAEIFLTAIDNEDQIELTSIETDANGEAVLIIESNYTFSTDEDGYTVIHAKYNGNDSLKSAKKKIEFMDLNIDISFEIIDSVKHISVYAFEIDSHGNKNPVEGVDLNIGVERLFSTLFLEEAETDEEGIGNMEFPDDIPGDSIGNIKVIVKVDEHDDYGTITKSSKINWGTIVEYSNASNGRSLFGDEAPLWMIISVFIVLIGAWYHFILATIKVIKIKKLGQKSV